MVRKIVVFTFVFVICFLGCSDPSTNDSSGSSTTTPIRATLAPLSTLVPTFTPQADSHLQVTITPFANSEQTAVEPTVTINFDEPTVQLVYRIPALSVDRRLEGNVSGQIVVFDETNNLQGQRTNQGNNLLDLQRRLPELELQSLPDGCDTCVYFQYTLPLSGESREGWLQDSVFLASIENYTTALVGPHFPPGTVVGLRREASFYYPAHSIALMSDGRIYTWLATEADVDEPFPTPLSFTDILTNLSLAELQSTYAANCLPEPVETMRIYTSGNPLTITIRCPAYALSTTLLPLYAQLDEIMAQKLATYDGPERPPTGLPLDAVLDYKRADGHQLTLSQNGRVTLQTNNQIIYTGTMTTTTLTALTTELLASGQLQLGLNTLLESEATSSTPAAEGTPERAPASFLLVRGAQGIVDGKFGQIDDPLLANLNALMESLLNPSDPIETGTPDPANTLDESESDETGTPDPANTPETEATPTPTS